MRLIRELRPGTEASAFAIVDDDFEHVGDDVALPEGDVIVSLARWANEKDALTGRSGRLGIRLPADVHLDTIVGDLARFAVVAIEFPKFTDGRGYSVSRRLHDQYGYRGELRAVGNVLRDQLQFMHRAGFTAFELDPKKDLEDALEAFGEFTVAYQAAADQPLPLWKRAARDRAR